MKMTKSFKIFALVLITMILSACSTVEEKCGVQGAYDENYKSVYVSSCEVKDTMWYGLINEKGNYVVTDLSETIYLYNLDGFFLYTFQLNDNLYSLVELESEETLVSGEIIEHIYGTNDFVVINEGTTSVFSYSSLESIETDFEKIEYFEGNVFGYRNDEWFLLNDDYNIVFNKGFPSKYFVKDGFISFTTLYTDTNGVAFNNVEVYNTQTQQSRLVLPLDNITILELTEELVVYKNLDSDVITVYNIIEDSSIEFIDSSNVFLTKGYIVEHGDKYYDIYDFTFNEVYSDMNIVEIVEDDTFVFETFEDTEGIISNGEIVISGIDISHVYMFDGDLIGIYYDNKVALYSSTYELIAIIDSSYIMDYYNVITYEVIKENDNFSELPFTLKEEVDEVLSGTELHDAPIVSSSNIVYFNGSNYYTFHSDGSIKELFNLNGKLIYHSK